MLFNGLIQCLLQQRTRRNRLRMVAGGSLCLLGLALALAQAALILFSISVRSPISPATAAAEPPLAVVAPDKTDTEFSTTAKVVALDDATPTPATGQRLRVLVLRQQDKPHQPALAADERSLLRDYAKHSDRELIWVLADSRAEMWPALRTGRGDLIAGLDLADAPERAGVVLTRPWSVSRQRVVTRRGDSNPGSLAELRTGTIAVAAGAPVGALIQTHAARHPDLEIVRLGEKVSPLKLLAKVAHGDYVAAVAGSGWLADALSAYPELDVAFELPNAENRVWAVRAGTAALRDSVDSYLSSEALSRSVAEVRFNGLPEIDERRLLRMITYHSPANYYLADNGELRGFEYDLVRRFAKQHGWRVEVVVAPSQQDMVRWLREGRGDLIAASVPTASVHNNPHLSVSQPYNYAAPLVIGRAKEPLLIDARDLEGRSIVLPAGSPHRDMLQRYRQRGIDVEIVTAEPGQSQAEILKGVANSVYDLTVIDSQQSRVLLAGQPGAAVQFPISEPLPHSWVLRDGNPKLLAAVNDYIADTYRGSDYNVLHARYFEHPLKYTPLEESGDELLALGGELSPYDELVRQYAEEFGFDWRLIVAQMYQESRFDPKARSAAGAIGLMQMLPSTADEVGITQLYKPEAAIHAGVLYLHQQYNRFDDELAFEDRMWFALAAYNAGFQRVKQARERAAEMGLDPDRWFGHVEEAMLTLSEDTRCDCSQPVAYVREIRLRYHNYVRLTYVAQYAARHSNNARRDS